MPAMITGKKTQQYSTEFKVKAVEWSHQAHRSVKGVAEALDIHPFMLSRWRKEYREGKFAMKRVKKAPAKAKQQIKEQDVDFPQSSVHCTGGSPLNIGVMCNKEGEVG